MSFVAVAIGGSALVGAGASLYASNTQAKAANNALGFQEQAFNTSQNNINQAKTNFQPYLDVGKGATYTLGQLTGGGAGGSGNTQPDYSSFFNSPDYNFAQSQGQRGVINAANAQGVGLSGGTLKDLATFNSGLASQQYGNYFNRLMGLSQLGSSAAAGLGNLATGQATNATNASNSIGNTMQGQGQAQASGVLGAANSLNSGISNSLLANYLGKNPSAYSSAANAGNSNAVSNGGFNYLDAQAGR